MSQVRTTVIFFLCLGYVTADYYSAISELERLIDVEAFIVEKFEDHLKKVQQMRDNMEDFLTSVVAWQDSMVESEKYFGNPINAIITIRRLVHQWKHEIFDQVFRTSDFETYKQTLDAELQEAEFQKPTMDDLLGATRGLLRLQETYKLPTEDLVAGILLIEPTNVTLSASDCFEIGVTLYELKEFRYAIEWLLQARSVNYETETFPSVNDTQILSYLAPALFYVGNYKLAQKFNSEILDEDPTDESALQNKLLYQDKLARQRNEKSNMADIIKEEQDVSYETYERVCRRELRQTPRQLRALRCHLSDRGVAYNRLGPFKVEQLSLDPYVAYYHGVVHASEIERLIDYGTGMVERSQIGNKDNATVSEQRTSKNTWLGYVEHSWLAGIMQRVEDITGLSMETAESLQLANYGIGGHYDPHYDFMTNSEENFGKIGNRILTALFYLNDMPMGGATAFPLLKLAVPPIKGSVLVWYNLHLSLENDYRTKHAACPVLKGSKWIGNIWFHAAAQEFRRPCGLTQDGAKSAGFE